MAKEKKTGQMRSQFWQSVEQASQTVSKWPEWKRAGVLSRPVAESSAVGVAEQELQAQVERMRAWSLEQLKRAHDDRKRLEGEIARYRGALMDIFLAATDDAVVEMAGEALDHGAAYSE